MPSKKWFMDVYSPMAMIGFDASPYVSDQKHTKAQKRIQGVPTSDIDGDFPLVMGVPQ